MTRDGIFNLPIEKTNLTVRTKNCLLNAKIFTFKDLLGNSYYHFLRFDGIGEKSVAEIIELVNSYGYKLNHQEFFYKKKATLPWVQKLIQEAVLSEREACALMLEEWRNVNWNNWDCAAAIRARGQQSEGEQHEL